MHCDYYDLETTKMPAPSSLSFIAFKVELVYDKTGSRYWCL